MFVADCISDKTKKCGAIKLPVGAFNMIKLSNCIIPELDIDEHEFLAFSIMSNGNEIFIPVTDQYKFGYCFHRSFDIKRKANTLIMGISGLPDINCVVYLKKCSIIRNINVNGVTRTNDDLSFEESYVEFEYVEFYFLNNHELFGKRLIIATNHNETPIRFGLATYELKYISEDSDVKYYYQDKGSELLPNKPMTIDYTCLSWSARFTFSNDSAFAFILHTLNIDYYEFAKKVRDDTKGITNESLLDMYFDEVSKYCSYVC